MLSYPKITLKCDYPHCTKSTVESLPMHVRSWNKERIAILVWTLGWTFEEDELNTIRYPDAIFEMNMYCPNCTGEREFEREQKSRRKERSLE